jgi:oxalate decarboxylase/phosphoglucose isomerase-like protein (cupin superfamily)
MSSTAFHQIARLRIEPPAPARTLDLPLLHDGSSAHLLEGRFHIVDSISFPMAKKIAAGLVEVEPRGMCELHWHPNSDELQYCFEGRMTGHVSVAPHKPSTTRLAAPAMCP